MSGCWGSSHDGELSKPPFCWVLKKTRRSSSQDCSKMKWTHQLLGLMLLTAGMWKQRGCLSETLLSAETSHSAADFLLRSSVRLCLLWVWGPNRRLLQHLQTPTNCWDCRHSLLASFQLETATPAGRLFGIRTSWLQGDWKAQSRRFIWIFDTILSCFYCQYCMCVGASLIFHKTKSIRSLLSIFPIGNIDHLHRSITLAAMFGSVQITRRTVILHF